MAIPTVTRDQLIAIIPECSHVVDKYVDFLNQYFERYKLSTPLRQACFIAQCGHESTRFTRVEENLNYSANGLVRTFGPLFPQEIAKDYAYKPQKIANRAYANKLGNGNEASGDGWRYRGRALIQVTLKNNYMLRGKRMKGDPNFFLLNPDLLLEPEYAVGCSLDYWDSENLNVYCDSNSLSDFRNQTRKINRALRGLDDRVSIWRQAKLVYGVTQAEEV